MNGSGEMFRKGYERGYSEGRREGAKETRHNIVRVGSDHETAVLDVQQTPLTISQFIADQISERMETADRIFTRPMNVDADVRTPLLMAAVTGGFWFAGGITLLSGVFYFAGASYQWYIGGAWASLLSAMWVTYGKWEGGEDLRHTALMTLERAIEKDLDGDGIIGKPKNAPIGKVFLKLPNNSRVIEDIPITHDQVSKMYNALKSNGWKFSRRKMKGILSQSEAQMVGEIFARHGMKVDDALNENGRDYVAALAGLDDE